MLQWKSNKYYIFWVRVCRLSYPGCNAHAPYCYLWPVRLYSIFPHPSRKEVIEYKMCIFFLQLPPEIFVIQWRIQRRMIKNVYWSYVKYPSCLSDDLKDRRGYCELKEEALDPTMWRNRFARGFGPVVWQIAADDDDFRKIFKFKISWKSAFSMRTDRRMDGRTESRDEFNSRFLQFCERV
jgi:hypothetical protein